MARNLTQSGSDTDARQVARARNEPAATIAPMFAEAEILTAALEPEVRQIIDTVVARVAEIEQEAVREARELSQRSEQGAREAASFALDRSLQLTSTLEMVAGTVTEMTAALRTGVDAVLEGLRGVQEARVESPDVEAEPEPESDGETLMDLRVEPSPELTEMFREQITMMRDDGKPRNEARRVLKRYRWGRHFFGMLDEIYSSDGSADAGRRGLIRKLGSRG